ncbi:hypothetical protein BGZ60DRAFT_530627 [Tricladium varicosporioides]|nr:hypothetical protein BGZ60DRAFT_530627 [Hymenoscyphus varicosporioides]
MSSASTNDGIEAIAKAFEHGAEAFTTWRSPKKRKRLTCEAELATSLEDGGPYLRSEYHRLWSDFGLEFTQGDDKSKFLLSETASELNITVVDLLKRAALSPGSQLEMQPEQMLKISERLKRQALDCMIELGRRVRPGPSSTARVYGDHVHSTLDLSKMIEDGDQLPANPPPPRSNYGGNTPVPQRHSMYLNPNNSSLRQLRHHSSSLSLVPPPSKPLNTSLQQLRHSASSFSLASSPPIPPKIAIDDQGLAVQQAQATRPVPITLYQHSLLSRTPLMSAPVTHRSFASRMSGNNSPTSPQNYSPHSPSPTASRNSLHMTHSTPNIPTRTSMGYASDILDEGRKRVDERWAAAARPELNALPEGSRLPPEWLSYGRSDTLGDNRRRISAPVTPSFNSSYYSPSDYAPSNYTPSIASTVREESSPAPQFNNNNYSHRMWDN